MLDISIKIAEYLRSKLDDNIYNLIQDDKAGNSFIVVVLKGLQGDYSKDFNSYYDVKFDLIFINNQHSTGINKVIEVNNLLEKRSIEFDDYILNNLQLSNFNENYSNNSYLFTLSYLGTIENK